ncbi:MAG: hypothetical protein PF693_10980 [Spirochaetia bacterium]|jgi:5,10-methenyltetrahydromethanopterin hydrogenase|nr:hypothetical protein [Spirochaetia bacterium]
MLEFFTDWQKKTANIKELITTKNDAGQTVESETVIASGITINWWIDNSNETNINDKFVDQVKGSALISPEYTLNTKQWMEIDSVKYYIIGVDDVAGFGEVTLVKWRRENA